MIDKLLQHLIKGYIYSKFIIQLSTIMFLISQFFSRQIFRMCRSGTSSPKHDNFWILFRMELKEEMWMNRKFIKWEAAKIDVLLKISI